MWSIALPNLAARGAASRHARTLVLERQDVREAIRVAFPLAVLVTVASTVLFAGHSPGLLAVGLAVLVALVCTWRLAQGRLRRRPHTAAFALVTVILAARFVPILLDLGGVASLAHAYFGLIAVASAVFLPWSGRWHGAWLAVAGSVYLLTLLAVPALAPGRQHGLAFAATAAIVSVAGNVLVRTRRRRTFSAELTLRDQRAALREAQAQLEVLVHEDALTGLSNRRRLNEDILVLEARLARGMPGLAAVMVDLDAFKAYNDAVGHPAADRILGEIAATVRGAVRTVDSVYRYGGEEILVLLAADSSETALATAERIVDAVRNLRLAHPGTPGGVMTVSAGAAASDGRKVGPWTVIDEADRALYLAKAAGRDRAVLYAAEQDEAVARSA